MNVSLFVAGVAVLVAVALGVLYVRAVRRGAETRQVAEALGALLDAATARASALQRTVNEVFNRHPRTNERGVGTWGL